MDVEIPISLDSDGFLRRECPGCVRQFKCFHGRHPDAPDSYEEPDVDPTCPYCGHSAGPDTWWTPAQADYLGDAAVHAAGPGLDDMLGEAFSGPGMSYEPARRGSPPEPPPEPDDMVVWEPPCHPWEPVKVEGAPGRFCFVCGEQAPA